MDLRLTSSDNNLSVCEAGDAKETANSCACNVHFMTQRFESLKAAERKKYYKAQRCSPVTNIPGFYFRNFLAIESRSALTINVGNDGSALASTLENHNS